MYSDKRYSGRRVDLGTTGSDLARLPICVSVVVWGERYTDFFLDFCLPSLLADGNFPAIRHRKDSTFIIHTSAADAEKIKDSKALRAASASVDVDLRVIDITAIPPHELLSGCHDDAITTADSLGRPIVFLSPDTVWSNNTFEAIDAAIASGKRVLFLPNVRAVKEDSLELLRTLPREGRIDINPRELMSLAIRHLHPTTEEHMVPAARGERLLPPALIWPTARGDLLCHFFHQHPLMVFPKRRFAKFNQTIDGDFVQFACPDPGDYQIVVDSDQAACVEFSSRSQFIAGITDKNDAQGVLNWAERGGANPMHWCLVSHRIRLHALPISQDDWAEVEQQADVFISRIFNLKRWWSIEALRSDAGAIAARVAAAPLHAIQAIKFALVWVLAKALGIPVPRAADWHKGALKSAVRQKMFRT